MTPQDYLHPLFKMSISGCYLPVLLSLLFITAVYSASVRDAFNMITPPESPTPEILSVSETLYSVHPPDPTAVCTTPAPVDNSAEILEASIIPEQGSLTLSDTADEKSRENSNSADRTDSDDRSSKKRKRLPENLRESPDYNSADSKSAERTNTDTKVITAIEERPSKTHGLDNVDQSSQEMDEHLNFETHKKKKRMMDRAKLSEGGIARTKEPEATNNYLPERPQTNKRNRKSKAELTLNIPLSDGQGGTDWQLDCVKVSSKTIGNLNGENPRTAGPDIDPQNKDKGITNNESQLRRMCAARKRLRTLGIPRDPLDPDSVERVNSELLDRDNSNERMDLL